jgi:hypothetical protein
MGPARNYTPVTYVCMSVGRSGGRDRTKFKPRLPAALCSRGRLNVQTMSCSRGSDRGRRKRENPSGNRAPFWASVPTPYQRLSELPRRYYASSSTSAVSSRLAHSAIAAS